MDKGALTQFNYAPLDRPTRAVLREHASQLKRLGQRTARNLWEMGRILANAQEKLSSYNGGSFVRWVTEEAGLTQGTAYRLMDVYRAFDISKLENGRFATSALYLLAKPSTPQAVRIEALQRAENGEAITHAKAQEMVASHLPPRPALPERPPKPPLPEYREFEKEKLLPHLHDAGIPDAPQMLSGAQEALPDVPAELKEKARTSLRESITEAVRGIDSEDQDALDACVDEILDVLSQGNNSIAISARFGLALASAPQTLADLTEIAILTCGVQTYGMDRKEWLRWRKRSLRLIDAISAAGGLAVYEHRMGNGQLCYSLLPSCD